jgi:hypothetical protein
MRNERKGARKEDLGRLLKETEKGREEQEKVGEKKRSKKKTNKEKYF